MQITIEPAGRTLECHESQTVLDACLRAGVWIPHACGHGLCATCKVQVVEGEYEHGEASPFALMDFEREEGKILACCARAQSDLVIEAEVDEDPDAQLIPLDDFVGTVMRLDALTPTILGIGLKLNKPIAFQAGQYLMLNIPGVEGARAFSIGNAPHQEEVELHIRLVPEGRATPWLHQQLKLGDQLSFTGPYGRFFVRESARLPMIFVAGGSGLSSPQSMILDLLARGATESITLVQGARTQAELYHAERFHALTKKHSNFHYLPVLSAEPEDSDWPGARGFAHEAMKTQFNNDFRGHKAYLCGPPPMIEATIATLMQGRLFEQDIYTEKFLTAADAESNARRSPLFKKL